MTKEHLMEYIRGYIVDDSVSWEDTIDYIIRNLDDFADILEKHLLSPNEFHSVLPFIKEILVTAPFHEDKEEVSIRVYHAILDCQKHYAEALKNTLMVSFIDETLSLFHCNSSESFKKLNLRNELMIFAILCKSHDLLQ
jgi:hypothetical protein